MPAVQPTERAERKRRGAYYTPPDLADLLADRTLADIDTAGAWVRGRPTRVLDPACGDGRLLEAMGRRLAERGHAVELTGCDIDADALRHAADRLGTFTPVHGDALTLDWGSRRFDIVVGNPPFLSQMATTTTRGGSSRHGGGPYADAAAEFLALAVELAEPGHGRIALILPQSILAARDAGPVRDRVDDDADLAWSWWHHDQRWFDASVNVCAVGLRRPAAGPGGPYAWTSVVTDPLGVPRFEIDGLATSGTIADRAELNANFRDEYYALVPAVADHAHGPPLVTSGLIDPATCHWGERAVTFAKRTYERPRVDVGKLEGRFPAWAARKLVPKVLIANQTRRIEAVADPDGTWLPGVPVTTATPLTDDPTAAVRTVREIEAALCSPVAAAICWHLGAGTGLSTTTVRVSPAIVGRIPWPAGDLTDAIEALTLHNLPACGRAVLAAYGLDPAEHGELLTWWTEGLPHGANGVVAPR